MIFKPFTFAHVNVKKEVQGAFKEWLPELDTNNEFENVKILLSDPQTSGELPCIGINRADDSEDSQSIADSEATNYDSQEKKLYTFRGTYFAESIEVRVWHTNADMRDKLYRFVKAMLFALRVPLEELGLMRITLRSGRDEQDNTQAFFPHVMYWASITVSYLNPLNIEFVEHDAEPIEYVGGGMTFKFGEEV